MKYIVLVVYTIALIISNKKCLQMYQQNRYGAGGKYFKWLKHNYIQIFQSNYLLYIIILIIVCNENYYFAVVLYSLLTIYNVIKIKLEISSDKLPLVYTPRVKRLIFTEVVINILCIVLLINTKNSFRNIIIFTTFKLIFNYILIVVPNLINKPIEKLVSLSYRKKAEKKLKSLNNMEVIGITGSYGKTSSKNILNDILNIKYNSLPTPLNYNTPHGLTITINNHLNKYVDFLIAEMGAYHIGEIKELTDFVKPKYGILTNIGVAHLESFGSQENIQKTKFELIESLPIDGLGILNKDDKLQLNYKIKNKVKIKYIAIEDKTADVYADNIMINNSGSSFDVYFKDKNKTVNFKTKLLGKANIYNLLAAILLGDYLGIEINKLVVAVRNVKPVEHRLELKKFFDMYLIDDAYNSNPKGAKMALDVIKIMNGQRVIITPGMIELGEKDKELHYEFGKQMAQSVDIAILIGKNKTKDIYKGLIDSKFNKNNIYVFNDVQEGFTLLKKLKKPNEDLYALIENDLPDSFKEGK